MRAAAADAPAASVVIPAYNASHTVRAALRSLAAQDLDEPFETIVVWSGDAATPGIVTAEFPGVRLVGRPQRLPTGAARNLGIAHAASEVVAFLAADCRAAPDWLRRRLAAHRDGFRCVGGVVLLSEPAGALARASHLLEYSECLPGRPREVVRDRPVYNLSFRREVFALHGGYCDALACGEDSLFNVRLLRAGEHFLFDPAIRIEHPGPATLREYVAHQLWHGEAYARLIREHGYGRDSNGRHPPLPLLLLRYPVVRLRLLLGRILRFRRDLVPDLLRLSPLIATGVAACMLGLVRGWSRTPGQV